MTSKKSPKSLKERNLNLLSRMETNKDLENPRPISPIEMTEIEPHVGPIETLGENFFGIADHFHNLNSKHLRRRAAAACVLFTIYILLLRFSVLGVFILFLTLGNGSICLFCFNQTQIIRSMTSSKARVIINHAVTSVAVGWERSKVKDFFSSFGRRWKKKRTE